MCNWRIGRLAAFGARPVRKLVDGCDHGKHRSTRSDFSEAIVRKKRRTWDVGDLVALVAAEEPKTSPKKRDPDRQKIAAQFSNRPLPSAC